MLFLVILPRIDVQVFHHHGQKLKLCAARLPGRSPQREGHVSPVLDHIDGIFSVK